MIILILSKNEELNADYYKYNLKNIQMKKRIIVVASIIIMTVVVFSSCKTHERCAAYGNYSKAQPVKTIKIAS